MSNPFEVVVGTPSRETVAHSPIREGFINLPINQGVKLTVVKDAEGKESDNSGKFRRVLADLQAANVTHASGISFTDLHLTKARVQETGELALFLMSGKGPRSGKRTKKVTE